MRVVFFQRKPVVGRNHSIEGFFRTVRAVLDGRIHCSVAESRFLSRGLWRRVYNVLEAPFRQGDVNHITGDIHYVSLLLRRRRTLMTIHDCGFENHPSPYRRFLLKWLWLLLPLKRIGLLVTDSHFTKDRVVKLSGYAAPIEVIPVCISPIFQRVERSFNIDQPTILQVGTNHNKNLDRVIQALTGLPCRLVIVGSVSCSQKRMLYGSGIEWTNHVGISDEELVGVYGAADIVLFASTYEGFGMPIVEAQTVGRPVITSNAASMPEVAGKGACLVDPYDVASIRKAVERVIDDHAYRDRLVENGYSNVERFRPELVADRYLALYERLNP